MEKILINVEGRNFTEKDYISLEELLNICEDLYCDKNALEEELNDVIQDRDDNFKRIKVEEQVDIYDIDFI